MAYADLIEVLQKPFSAAQAGQFDITLDFAEQANGALVQGELLVIAGIVPNDDETTMNTPSGWTSTFNQEIETADGALFVFIKPAVGNETDSVVTITHNRGTGLRGCFFVMRWQSWGAIKAAATITTDFGSPSESDAPSVTADSGAGDNTFLCLLGLRNDDTPILGAPSGYSNFQQFISGAGENAGCSLAMATKQSTSASDDPGAWNWSGDTWYGTITLVIEPGSNGVPGYSLDVTSVNGTVTKNPDKELYDPGEVVELTADPDPGWKFDSWTGDVPE